ncbi:anaerobic sulfatase maturase [Niallia sp. Krafla_26]|uniref:anaerobic sulfatase maturase n=1 Tax=Niallia sp. Krafla_26 TaxID=3064703 RepID=UPI003D1701CE
MEHQLNVQKGFHILAKPTGPLCNLDCEYCFYTEKEALFSGKPTYQMSDEVLETFIKKYIESQIAPEVPFVWQGGEPTLIGLDFYKKVIKFQSKYAKDKVIKNSIQTNGTLLDEEWCEFLAENQFMVGLSLDGPQFIHDRYRVDRGQKPTFEKVMRALTLLKEYGVEYNVLTCVTNESTQYSLEIYRFFKEQGIRFIQFIPIVERTPNRVAEEWGLRHAAPSSPKSESKHQQVTSWTVDPQAYGDFLIQVFNEWVRHDVGDIHIMNFEWALTSWLGLPSNICIFSESCGQAVVMEHTGDIYSCDHYVYPSYKLGNIVEDNPVELVYSVEQESFGASKKLDIPGECQTCEVRFACHGECPKRRFMKTQNDEPGLNYLCKGYKKYFRHIHPYMKVMVQLIKNNLPASNVMDVIKGPIIIKTN